MSVPDARTQLGEAVRAWIHMDNLCENHLAQAANAREKRTAHEQEAIKYIKQLNYQGTTLQVSGATLELQTKSVAAPPSWGFLEKEIAAWGSKSGVNAAQCQSLVKWLHDHREVKEVEHLRKKGSRSKTPARS